MRDLFKHSCFQSFWTTATKFSKGQGYRGALGKRHGAFFAKEGQAKNQIGPKFIV
jgi:hypothetical protein